MCPIFSGPTPPLKNADDQTLTSAESKLQKMAELLLDRLEKRFVKTGLHKASIISFGEIHWETNNDNMVTLLQEVISALPDNQSVLFDAESCYPGFLAWNDFWKNAHAKEDVNKDLDPLSNVHIYYENWVKSSKSADFSKFQKLWENVMIRSCSEAVCETIGSMMNQHGGKNRHLSPKWFSIEMVLRANLGPLHLLDKNLVQEIFESNLNKSYLREETRISQLFSSKGDIKKSSGLSTFEEKCEKKSRFPSDFWLTKSTKPE